MSTTLGTEFDWGSFDKGAKYGDRLTFVDLMGDDDWDVVIDVGGGENRFRPKDCHKLRMALVDADNIDPKDIWHRLINLLERNQDLWLYMSY